MHCLVTAGATVEPIDEVRYISNNSTGRLGCLLADSLARTGHRVALMLSKTAQWKPRSNQIRINPFGSASDLHEQMKAAAAFRVKAIFHVAAVSDFTVKTQRGKISSSAKLSLDLKPSPKIIRQLRKWHPSALIVGWKYEVIGDRITALEAGFEQIHRCKTDGCVVNGPAYGDGFGWVTETSEHFSNERALFAQLRQLTSPR